MSHAWGMAANLTTIRVRVSTRDAIVRAAQARGQTIDEYLSELQQEQTWREQMAAARVAMADPDDEYLEETAAWEVCADHRGTR